MLDKLGRAAADYLADGKSGGADERLEKLVYGRFLEPESRKEFFEAYKEIEALWEILSPSPELRDHIETFRRLARLYETVRNAYASGTNYTVDLANKTRLLVQENATQEGLGRLTKTVTFDVSTLEALQIEPGLAETKVFNLVRGLRQEIESNPDKEPVLLPLKERAESILKELENRKTTALAAMDRLADLAAEKEAAIRAERDSGLSSRAFAIHWALKDNAKLKIAGIDTLELAQRAETLLDRFPNAAVNADEQRRLRTALYVPLLRLQRDERSRVVERILGILGASIDADV